jgi:hypothetical protein
VYAFQVTGPATLKIDGIPVTSRILAARGLHYVELTGDAAQPPTLLLGGVELGPRQTYRLMDAPWGLLGAVDSPSGDVLPAPANSFLDAAVAMAFFEPELGAVSWPNRLRWTGTLLAPTTGTYRMAFAAEDPMHFEVDGRPIDVVTVSPDRWPTVGRGSPVPLTAGPHQVQITLDITHGGRELARWNWIPPQPNGSPTTGDPWTVVPPMTLRPEPPIRPLP